jgi:hypothetical protein
MLSRQLNTGSKLQASVQYWQAAGSNNAGTAHRQAAAAGGWPVHVALICHRLCCPRGVNRVGQVPQLGACSTTQGTAEQACADLLSSAVPGLS